MKRLYLASSIDRTAKSIALDLQNETGKKPKDLKLAFIYTAAEPEGIDEDWLKNDRRGLVEGGFNVFDYTITDKNEKDIKKDLGDANVIHVNGGNTFYLLLQARKSGFDKWIKKEVESGNKIYTGSSAGSHAIAPDVSILSKNDTILYEKKLKDSKGIGLIDFMIFPHWGNENRELLYLEHRMKLAYNPENKIILLNDWQYVKVVGDTYKIVDVRD